MCYITSSSRSRCLKHRCERVEAVKISLTQPLSGIRLGVYDNLTESNIHFCCFTLKSSIDLDLDQDPPCPPDKETQTNCLCVQELMTGMNVSFHVISTKLATVFTVMAQVRFLNADSAIKHLINLPIVRRLIVIVHLIHVLHVLLIFRVFFAVLFILIILLFLFFISWLEISKV